MNTKIFFTTIVTAAACLCAVAQNRPSIPVSPEAAALTKMVNYPVNLNTGIPSISVPFYEIKTGGLTLPIAINYHSGGFKINERSTNVGLGWSLSTDIQITRSVNGLDDFLSGSVVGYIANTKMKAHNTGATYYPLNTGTPFPERNVYDIAAGLVDGSPDKFTYSLLGKSGSFYFQKDNAGTGYTIVSVPFDDIKIEFINGQFRITDTDGTVYTYGTQGAFDLGNQANNAKEVSGGVNSTLGSCIDCVVTAWKCKKIVNATKTDSIQFTYQKKADISYNRKPESVEYFSNSTPCALNNYFLADQITTANPSIVNFEHLTSLYPFYNLSSPKYIEHFSDKPSVFHLPMLNSSNQVVDKEYPLTQDVNSISSSVAGLALSRIDFRGGSVIFSGADQLNYIKVQDAQNNEIKSFYLFQSFATAVYTSAAKSANGQSFNGTMYLDSVQVRNSSIVYQRYGLMYIDKFCFGDHLKGKDAWGYSNDFTAERSATQSNIAVPRKSIIQTFYKSIIGGCSNFVSNVIFNIGSTMNTEPPSRGPSQHGILKRIIYPTGGYVDFDFESNKYETGIVNNQQATRMGGGLRVRSINYFDGKAMLPVSQKYYRYGELENGIGLAVNAPPLSVTSGVDYDAYSYAQKTAYITGPPSSNLGNNFDPVPANCFTRSCLTLRFREDKTTYLPASALEYTYSTGAPIYYTQVTEYNQDMGKSTGKAVHIFYKPNDFGAYFFTSASKIFGTNIDVQHTDGLMGKQKYLKKYKYENGTYSLVHSKDYVYSKVSKPDKVKVVYSRFKTIYQVIGGAFNGNHMDLYNTSSPFMYPSLAPEYEYDAGEYGIEVARLLLTQEKEKWVKGTDTTFVNTQFYYDNPQYKQLSRTVTTDSKNRNITKTFKYSYDFTGQTVYDQMRAKNMLSQVIEEIVTNSTSGVELSRLKTDYASFTAGTTYIAPSAVKKSVGGNALTTELSFDLYDNYVNPLQTTEKGRIKSYIYGYNYNYPVAEIEGANYVTSASGITIPNIQTYTDAQLKTLFAGKRTSLSSAFVKSYTYKPLVGITSQTDQKGKTTSFAYDAIGRLDVVRDQNENIVKKYDYLETGKTSSYASAPYYVNIPIVETYNKYCPDVTARLFNYVYWGGQNAGLDQPSTDSYAEQQLVANGPMSGTADCSSPVANSTISIRTDFASVPPWPQDVNMMLFKENNLEVSLKFPAVNLQEKILKIPSGTYTIAWREENNYNRSVTYYTILSSLGAHYKVRSGQQFTFQAGILYYISVGNAFFYF